jgi:DNA-directed RNA polymerase III subunit RPC6
MSTPEELAEIGHRIIALAQEKPGGLTNDDLVQNLSDVSAEHRVQSINRLILDSVLEIFRKGDTGNTLIYRLKDPAKKSTAPKDIDNEEKIVYQIIEDGGNKGIWIRDIRTKSNLIMTQLNKVLKNLENRKLIKAVKSVNVRRTNLIDEW